MYDFPGTAGALDQVWAAVAVDLRNAGVAGVPEALTRDRAVAEIWRDPDLLVAQTCGYPLLKHLAGRVRVVATPIYAWPGCRGALHRSFIIVSADSAYTSLAELRGARLALNGYDSNTGMNLLRAALAPVAEGRPMFASVRVTGAHAASLAEVANGMADVAAIDCVSFALIAREQPLLASRVHVLATTPESPGLPIVTRWEAGEDELTVLRTALSAAVASPELARDTLGLADFAVLAEDAYDVVLRYEAEATARGFPFLE